MQEVQNSLPFTTIPVKMLTHMTFFVVKMLNYFPIKGSISSHYSPKTIMSGETMNYKQCSLPFGSYCKVHEEDGPCNSLAAHTQGAISLGPSSNRQGDQLFLSLNTGKVLLRRSSPLPMPSNVIQWVNDMLTFADRDSIKFLDNKDLAADSHDTPLTKAHGVSVTVITEQGCLARSRHKECTDRPSLGLEMSPTKAGVIYKSCNDYMDVPPS